MTDHTSQSTASAEAPERGGALQNLTVLGSGVLGSQIALQAAFHGKDVTIYDISETALASLSARWDYLAPLYVQDLTDATPERMAEALGRIRTTSDLADAVVDADLIIEAVPEVLEVKQQTWAEVGRLALEETIFATNSSTFLPSDIAQSTGRPSRFLALHFANEIWRLNIGEVMGHPDTDPDAYEAVAGFAEEIGMVPIRVLREQPGYVLNSLLVPFLWAAGRLLVRGVADPETVDRTWRISTGAPLGPFQFLDIIGMMTPYNLLEDSDDSELRAFADLIKRDYIETGRLGKGAGAGFYDYS
ncbi:3-hydroxyacyl-CoA dehydrogenase [Nocardioides seonyuensis]|uniref:3-hydroxyacyl-CoA dehydrogenase n=1 Tax=Nocardioides seonyuensis TaxID=2518371 RepID=A0A4P7IEH7_9ACTN|nr:3-hydroxyacyl-CoA dehydrogenase [Nocardioides seonyuensis]QBX55644.1 3-hydroxyacyl-CoA dehydrogenase [Nocardioides seonyuensis]